MVSKGFKCLIEKGFIEKQDMVVVVQKKKEFGSPGPFDRASKSIKGEQILYITIFRSTQWRAAVHNYS